MTPARKKASITMQRISALDKAPQYTVQHMNYPFGVLVGDRADNGSDSAKMRWKLILTPKMTEQKGWPAEKVMSLAGARKHIEQFANIETELAEQQKYVAIQYLTDFGFELYLDHNDQLTPDISEAKYFTYGEAGVIMNQVTIDSPSCPIEGDLIEYVQTYDKLRKSSDSQRKVWIRLRHLERLKMNETAAA